MARDDEGRKTRRPAQFSLSAAAVWMFIIVGFIVPGAWGAMRGLPLPIPWSDHSWSTWIWLWLGVSIATFAISTVVFRVLLRKR